MMEINWFSVPLAIAAHYLLGALWFSPFLFGKLWDKAIGFKRPKGWKPTPLYYLGPLAGSVAVSIGTAGIVLTLAYVPLSEALLATGLLGLCYAVAVSFVNTITPNTPRPLLYGTVTGGYHLVGILLVTVILYALN
jgi:hypothetical protein